MTDKEFEYRLLAAIRFLVSELAAEKNKYFKWYEESARKKRADKNRELGNYQGIGIALDAMETLGLKKARPGVIVEKSAEDLWKEIERRMNEDA